MGIWNILLGGFGYVFMYWKSLGKALLLPFLIMIAIGLYNPEPEYIDWSLFFLTSVASIIIYTVIAIITHRVILLGPSSVPEWGFFKLTKRELYFVLYSIGIVVVMIPLGFFSFIPTIGLPITVLSMAYVLGRLSLVFPAIATDQAWTFSQSWKATDNHQVLMMVVVVIFPLAMTIPEILLSYIPYATILVNVVSSMTLVFVVAALSVAFKVITEGNPESEHG